MLAHKERHSILGPVLFTALGPVMGHTAGLKQASILDPVVVNNKLQIRLREHLDGMADGLTEKEAPDLDRDGYLIKDLRDEKSQAYRVTSQLQLENPGHNGLYELLLGREESARHGSPVNPRQPSEQPSTGPWTLAIARGDFVEALTAFAGPDDLRLSSRGFCNHRFEFPAFYRQALNQRKITDFVPMLAVPHLDHEPLRLRYIRK